jgi:hypothetical protein
MIDQAEATRRRTSARTDSTQPVPDRAAQIIAIARVWDMDPAEALPAPRDGWEGCFTAAALRGFQPRTVPAIGD